MGNDFDQTHFYIAGLIWAVVTIVATVAVARMARSDAPAPSPVLASIFWLPVAVATLTLGAGFFIGVLGSMLDDELISRPGKRVFVVDASWYLWAAVTDPTGYLNPRKEPGPNPACPGWLAWFTVSGIVTLVMFSLGWRWTLEHSFDRMSNLLRR
ncbi:hypothetical protein [Frigoriglobus tundricola]|uniref:Uncharacterized protein n=1 Tax=Frigoriglobus tundricola TaxID=2774151 RepID=A0A6M5YHL8_9BACT|nr:hypothetical protein [Frigoriglobus tundricola]QJW93537.1 hypothetical protein FTUN_1044 [Frigoriglobus tundricola]